MNVLMLSAEVAPFASVGGLSQVLYYLSKSLLKEGHDVRIFSPFHGKIQQRKYKTKVIIPELLVPTDCQKKNLPETIACSIRIFRAHHPIVYFVENREYYTLRENVFGYADDHQRFYLMCKAALEWLVIQHETKGWMPDIIHAHDWHAGYFVELARSDKRYEKILRTIPILYSVHNFHFQGNLDFTYRQPAEKDRGTIRLKGMLDPKLQYQNALLRGILHADWINTVSPSHAIEVLTPEYGEGLETYLQKKRGILSGVINGLDTKTFDPANDPLVVHNYSVGAIEKRIANKAELQKEFGLEERKDVPVIAFLGRLDKQKGLHLILDMIEDLLQEMDIQLVVLGGGDQQIANEFRQLQLHYPKKVGTHLYANFKLPRKVFAGADMILMPSMFEPGGIVALEALRYGCIPIVRHTGGLADVIHDFDPNTKKGNGFSFEKPTGRHLLVACVRALETYKNHKLWKVLMHNAMNEDFSWDHSSLEYVKLYKKAMKLRKHKLETNPNPAFH